ncbi:MAG: ribonuclease P protein subunit [Thermoplasmata archaeon]|nr:ribonuclease P protein subunit [Thermoplasmata archaeon]
MKAGDFRRRESIGLWVEVVESACAEYLGIKGTVVDETRNTLTIEQDGKDKMVPKESCRFRFVEGPESHIVSGNDIKFRPEDRIKKVR